MGKHLRGEIGPFLGVKYGLEEQAVSLQPKEVSIRALPSPCLPGTVPPTKQCLSKSQFARLLKEQMFIEEPM